MPHRLRRARLRHLPVLLALLVALPTFGCAADPELVEVGEPLEPHLALSGRTRLAAGARIPLKILARDTTLAPIEGVRFDASSEDPSVLAVDEISDVQLWLQAVAPGATTLVVSGTSAEHGELRPATVGVEVARAATVRVEGCPPGPVLIDDGPVAYSLEDTSGRSLSGDVSGEVRWSASDGTPLTAVYEQGPTGDRWWSDGDPRGTTLDFDASVGEADFELVGAAAVRGVGVASTSELGADVIVELALTGANSPVCIGDPSPILAEVSEGPCRLVAQPYGAFRVVDGASAACRVRFSVGPEAAVELAL